MAVICSLLISSCKVGRDYVRPETSLNDTFRGTVADDGMALDSVNIADIPWSAFFNDNMLTMLIDSAIANNYEIQAALKKKNRKSDVYGKSEEVHLYLAGLRLIKKKK